jgi:hypothetical protein
MLTMDRARELARQAGRGLSLAWALALTIAGASGGMLAALTASRTDDELLQVERAVHYAGTDARGVLFFTTCFCVGMLIVGLHRLRRFR